MNGYEPLDLSAWCNAGQEVLGDGQPAPVGRQSLRGLPFQVGGEGKVDQGRCFVALDGTSSAVTISVGQKAHRVIFAHRLLESELLEGGELGVEVAEYVFRLSGGIELRVPVRERFEIGMVFDPDKPQGSESIFNNLARKATVPTRAVSDRSDPLHPRLLESPEKSGLRQMESAGGTPVGYLLWAWVNPHPDLSIESLDIVPKGKRFIVAGITLGRLDEHPFPRQGRREARIILTNAKDAEEPFGLEVEVDRGVATYAQPLPAAPNDDFLKDPYKGWGQAPNTSASPAYVEIAAIPSAEVKVRQGGKLVGAVRWGDVEEKGTAVTPNMRVDLLDRGRNWVHVTVLDDDTERPVPCRVHFRSPEGIPYQPHGHHNHINSNLGTWHIDVGGDLRLGQVTYAYIDGTCQGWLPRGDVIVDVARGPEYEPLRATVRIEPRQRELTLRIKRWTNMNAQRWFSGDSHVHFLSTQGSHLESQAEDLNVVNLLQAQWGSLFTGKEEFTGRPSVSQEGNNIVYATQENRQHYMGHMILWGLKQPVMPWSSGGPNEGEIGGTLETVMSYWADECHAQGGTVIIPHFPYPNGETAALIATGRIDGVEMLVHGRFEHSQYYKYLNCGYRLPLVGGTDKMSSEVPVGMYRTYAYVPEDEEFNYDNWCKSVAQGRSFLSGGPIVHFSVDGHDLGDTVRLSGAGTVEVEARAESVLPIYRLEVVQQGRVVASTEDRNGSRRLELRDKVRVDGHTWLAARCGGPEYFDSVPHHDVWNRGVFAHTSPIYVACGGDWWMFDEGAARYMLTLIDGGITYIDETAPVYRPGGATRHHGEEDHLAYLRRPFLEARNAIHERLEELGLAP
jgi:hypothetical protein